MKHKVIPSHYRSILCVVISIIILDGISTHAASIPGKTYLSSRSDITSLACDERYLWAGTHGGGLIRIDKTSGKAIAHTLSDSSDAANSVRTLAVDNEGALYAVTIINGIIRYDGMQWEQVHSISDSSVRCLAVDRTGTIWAWMLDGGVVRRDAGAWIPVVNQFFGVLTTSPAGNVWLLSVPPLEASHCNDGWIREYIDGEMRLSIPLSPVCAEISERPFMVVDDSNNCWIATRDLLIKIAGDSVSRFPLSKDTANKQITALAINRDNVLLVALANYSTKTHEVFLHDATNDPGNPLDSCVCKLEAPYINTACADPSAGGFWCATLTGKIIRIDELNRCTFFTTGNAVLPDNSIASLLVDASDDVWVATPQGIARCHDTVWTTYPTPSDSMPGQDVSCLAMDSSGTIWAGFQQPLYSSMVTAGLAYFTGNRWLLLSRDHIASRAIAVDANGDQWVVSDDGVYRYHDWIPERFLNTDSVRGPSYGPWVNTIAFDADNTPWIGTNQGLKQYKQGAWVDDTVIYRHFPELEDSAGVIVTTLCIHEGTAWIGTARGLLKCSAGRCERIDTANGMLPDCQVQCIAADGPDCAWIGTRHGLVRLNGQEHTTYTTENTPLCDDDITACTLARNGDIWVGTRKGGLTIMQHQGTPVIPGATIKRGGGKRPVEISYSFMQNRTCCISIRTDKPVNTIGFSILSLQGKLIRRINGASMETQSTILFWDGTDRCNRSVSAGIYLGVVTSGGKIIGSKVLPRE